MTRAWKHWRKWGAWYCLFAMSLGFVEVKLIGFVLLFMLTVPCGCKWINKNKVAWFARQAYFAGAAILFIFFT